MIGSWEGGGHTNAMLEGCKAPQSTYVCARQLSDERAVVADVCQVQFVAPDADIEDG